MVGVSLNYRLSAFGFPQGKQALEAGIANIGFLDQRLALRWINENIAAFGGSPDKVTIWGESSGAESVSAQVFAYNGKQALTPFHAWRFVLTLPVPQAATTGSSERPLPSRASAASSPRASRAALTTRRPRRPCLTRSSRTRPARRRWARPRSFPASGTSPSRRSTRSSTAQRLPGPGRLSSTVTSSPTTQPTR